MMGGEFREAAPRASGAAPRKRRSTPLRAKRTPEPHEAAPETAQEQPKESEEQPEDSEERPGVPRTQWHSRCVPARAVDAELGMHRSLHSSMAGSPRAGERPVAGRR